MPCPWRCRHIFPILPTTPFFLVTLYCYARSSERLHSWFINTEMYKKHLDSYVKKKGMLMQTKLTILCTVTALMGFGFFMMMRKGLTVPCIILASVWACHLLYFLFGVKTIKPGEAD